MKIYQIETSAFCNAKCIYCPHHLMTRKQGNMSTTTFLSSLSKMENNYCALHHFGEPTLNPLLPRFVRLFHVRNIKVEFSTNGSQLETLVETIKEQPYLIRYAVDYTNAKYLKTLDEFCKRNNVLFDFHSVINKTKPFINFAGAIEGKSEVSGECYFKKYSYVCVLWNGDIVPCCCDYDGKEIIGNVKSNDPIKFKSSYDLCNNCSGLQFAEGGLW